jgi:hypothetical protein
MLPYRVKRRFLSLAPPSPPFSTSVYKCTLPSSRRFNLSASITFLPFPSFSTPPCPSSVELGGFFFFHSAPRSCRIPSIVVSRKSLASPTKSIAKSRVCSVYPVEPPASQTLIWLPSRDSHCGLLRSLRPVTGDSAVGCFRSSQLFQSRTLLRKSPIWKALRGLC